MLGQSLSQPDMAQPGPVQPTPALPDWDKPAAVLTQADIAGLSGPGAAKEGGNG
jgi:hypothetical protein